MKKRPLLGAAAKSFCKESCEEAGLFKDVFRALISFREYEVAFASAEHNKMIERIDFVSELIERLDIFFLTVFALGF